MALTSAQRLHAHIVELTLHLGKQLARRIYLRLKSAVLGRALLLCPLHYVLVFLL